MVFSMAWNPSGSIWGLGGTPNFSGCQVKVLLSLLGEDSEVRSSGIPLRNGHVTSRDITVTTSSCEVRLATQMMILYLMILYFDVDDDDDDGDDVNFQNPSLNACIRYSKVADTCPSLHVSIHAL